MLFYDSPGIPVVYQQRLISRAHLGLVATLCFVHPVFFKHTKAIPVDPFYLSIREKRSKLVLLEQGVHNHYYLIDL